MINIYIKYSYMLIILVNLLYIWLRSLFILPAFYQDFFIKASLTATKLMFGHTLRLQPRNFSLNAFLSATKLNTSYVLSKISSLFKYLNVHHSLDNYDKYNYNFI